jgi:hypothetical protein
MLIGIRKYEKVKKKYMNSNPALLCSVPVFNKQGLCFISDLLFGNLNECFEMNLGLA